MIERFNRFTNAFNYYYERELKAGERALVAMPSVSGNARGINDIAFSCSEEVTVMGTIDKNIASEKALWQEIITGEEVNKTVSGLLFINNSDATQSVRARVILY